MIKLSPNKCGFDLYYKNHLVLSHKVTSPAIILGYGEGQYKMNHGMFKISEKVQNRIPLTTFNITSSSEKGAVIDFPDKLTMNIAVVDDRLEISFESKLKYINRFWFNMSAIDTEHIYGCGEQYSELDLRGKKVPIWCEEHGIGRGKNLVSFLAEIKMGAGGDWYTTYFPQPTFVSSSNYYCHVETTDYAVFDFTDDNHHQLYLWGVPEKFVFDKHDTAVDTVKGINTYLGIQPEVSDWVYNGIWLGVQGGTDIIDAKLEAAKDAGVDVGALWVQDWEGKRITSFGKQLMWNWVFDNEMYPDLPAYIKKLKGDGIRFLGYINPFLAIEKELYKEASEKGYVIKDNKGEDYLVYVTTFPAAQLDLSNPDTIEWIKGVIKKNMIDIGLDGWMADYGEYLPIDTKLHSGEDAISFHNKYPPLWADVNRQAIEEAGKSGEVVFFSRSGYTGTSKASTLIWGGDQNVDWSKNDGLRTVVPAALSLSFCGIGQHHSDIGGFTTILWLKRSKELLLRWLEHSAFTPIMRTHEGSRPDSNWQFDSDEETLQQTALMSKIHTHIAPYIKDVAKEYYQTGLPIMRHPYIHYENDKTLHQFKYNYMLGRDLFVSSVYKPKKKQWKCFLPNDEWVHIWTGAEYKGGWVTVDAPIGNPPVFYRKGSSFSELFDGIRKIEVISK